MTPFVMVASSAELLGSDADGPDEDQPLLDAALDAAGIRSAVAAWDDDEAAWDDADLVVIRSTWDYAASRDRFCAWADRVDAEGRLHNPAAVVRWNTDKGYLRELAAAGIEVTPTVWFDPGDEVRLPDGGEIVVKPTISAGAKDTTRHDLDGGRDAIDSAGESVRGLLGEGRSVMVQPYLHAVDEVGETGLVFIDGQFNHAFTKAAILQTGRSATDRLYAPEQIVPTEPSAAELALARRCLDVMPFAGWTPLYARVDVAPDSGGSPVLMELELVEPSLFFAACGTPAEPLVKGIVSRLGS